MLTLNDDLYSIVCPLQRQPLEHTVLRIKEMDEDLQPHVLLGTALDPPSGEMVDRAILTLKQLGALTLPSRTSRESTNLCLLLCSLVAEFALALVFYCTRRRSLRRVE